MTGSSFPRTVYDGAPDLPSCPGQPGAEPCLAPDGTASPMRSRRQLVDLAAHLDVLGRHDEAARVMAMHDSDAAVA